MQVDSENCSPPTSSHFEPEAFNQIHLAAFIYPQRVIEKIVEEGTRNKGQQTIMVELLKKLSGLSLFRYGDQTRTLFTQAASAKLEESKNQTLAANNERNLRTMVTLMINQATKENSPALADIPEFLVECCLPHLRPENSQLVSLALEFTSQILSRVTLKKLALPQPVGPLLLLWDLLDKRDHLLPEDVGLTLFCHSKFMDGIRQMVDEGLQNMAGAGTNAVIQDVVALQKRSLAQRK